MKIMTFTHESDLNGASKSLLSLIDHLSDRHEFWIVTKFNQGAFYDAVQARGLHVLVYPFVNWMQGHERSLRGDLGWLRRRIQWYLQGDKVNDQVAEQIANIINEQNIDLLYTNTRVVDIGMRCSHIAGVPHILHVREFGEEDFSIYPLIPNAKHIEYIKENSDSIIYNSYAVERKFARYQFRKQYVVYNGVAPSSLETRHNDTKIIFLISGRVSEAKGQLDAVKAARVLQERGCHNFELWIAGSTDATYREFESELRGMEDIIKVLGYRTDMDDLRQRSDIELVCSVQEAFGRVTIEAMMAGNPVIGSNAGGTPELIEDGINGYLYEKGDATMLADRMQYFLENIPQITVMGNAARRHAETCFTVEQYVRNMESILDSYNRSK